MSDTPGAEVSDTPEAEVSDTPGPEVFDTPGVGLPAIFSGCYLRPANSGAKTLKSDVFYSNRKAFSTLRFQNVRSDR